MAEQKTYDPSQIEPRWMNYWLAEDLYRANSASKKEPYSIVIPPPNVTGSLHLGHALNNTLQDILCRYMRMRGREVLWMPGTDHAGIATQNVVERQIAQEGKTRWDFGREKFIERVWEWKAQSGGQIINQLKRLGCSCDWSRERFTMDDGLSRAVRETFVRLFKEGMIYRGDYMINWCPRCESALSDLEVEYPDEPESGFLYQFRYEIVDPDPSGPTYVAIETTRPETMLGDTAVAVHPDDERYRGVVGKKLKLPLVGRIIPIIADSFVDPAFGSGAVKLTPGHDPNDFEAGRRHGLELVSVIGSQGKMTKAVPEKYWELDRFDARKQVLADLEKVGAYVGKKPHELKTGRCYRCQSVTEPLVSTQWFMRMRELADQAASAVRDGQTKIVPASWEATYFNWLDNIRDWCISRQLWWGHQIPVWYCGCGELIGSVETPASCPKCGSKELKQDPDVLDTWFSSALWPFSTMDWPEDNETLRRFYPTSVLVTGFDILFFWVARMMMMGIKLTNQIPFYDIFLHAMVRDEHGQKMSKTKGNVIDPLDIIKQYGADALRFTLAILTVQGRDVNLAMSRIEGYRNFINKVWNAVKYVNQTISLQGTQELTVPTDGKSLRQGDLFARWIFSRLATTVQANEDGYAGYHFSEICTASYRFIWDEFCAWYLEITKLQLKDASAQEKQRICTNLAIIADVSTRLLHPIVPFVSEEIWSSLPELGGAKRTTLSFQPFPTLADFGGVMVVDAEAETKMHLFCEVVSAVRTIRAEKNLPPAVALPLCLEGEKKDVDFILSLESYVKGLGKISSITVGAPAGAAATKVVLSLKVSVPLEGTIDPKAERERVKKELQRIDSELTRAQAKLNSEDFRARAPREVVEKEERKVREYEEQIKLLRAAAQEIGAA